MLQRSPEWYQVRCGKLTASRFHEAVARTQKGWAASRHNYMWELLMERMTGAPKGPGWVSSSMQFGIDNEPKARAAYEFYRAPVQMTGFIDHPHISYSGCSPDGYVGLEGLVEFKVPESPTHGRILLGEPISNAYMLQMMWQLACCPERRWVDFVSYDPRQLEHLSMKVIRVHRDPDIIRGLEDEARQFLHELETKLTQLNSLADQRAA
jgi:hypothetical protein